MIIKESRYMYIIIQHGRRITSAKLRLLKTILSLGTNICVLTLSGICCAIYGRFRFLCSVLRTDTVSLMAHDLHVGRPIHF